MTGYLHLYKRFLLFAVGLLLAFLPTVVFADEPQSDPIADLLRGSSGVSRVIPYWGKLSYFRLVDEQQWRGAIEIYRANEQDKKIRFLAPGFLKDFVLLQNKDGIWMTPSDKEKANRIQAGNREFLWYRLFRGEDSLKFSNVELLRKNYTVVDNGVVEVAGRAVHEIHINPNIKKRPRLRLWIDRETKMLLKYERDNYKGELYESFVFEEIKLGNRIPPVDMSTEGLESAYKATPPTNPPAEPPAPDFALLQIDRLPEGFVFEEKRSWNGREGIVVHTLYTDGVAYLSFFQRKMNEEEKKKQEEEERDQPKDKPLVKEINRRNRMMYMRDIHGVRVFGVGDISSKEIIRTLVHVCAPQNQPESKPAMDEIAPSSTQVPSGTSESETK